MMDRPREARARFQRRPVGLLLVAFTLVAVAYSIAIPLFEGPDEDDHFRYVKFIADHRALPVQLFQAGGGAAGHQGWQPPLFYALAAAVISPLDTSDFETHLWRNPAVSFQGDRACCGRNLYFHSPSEDFPFTQTTLAVHLARLVTILFGLVTVATVYALMLTIVPSQPWLALAAASVVGFNPGFLFASALVSNDVPLAAFCSLALLVCAKLLKGTMAPTMKTFSVLGIIIALGVLVKTTALTFIPVSLATAFWLAHDAPGFGINRQIITNAVIGILLPSVVLTGWWFVRNQILYGDPMAYRLIYVSAIFPRESPLTLPEFFQINLPWLWQTFWGGPTPGDLSPAVLWVLLALTLLGLVGSVLSFASTPSKSTREVLVLLAAWLVLIFGAQVEFIRTSGGTDQGRYLFPAIASFAVLGVLGLYCLASHAGALVRRISGGNQPARTSSAGILVSVGGSLALLAFALSVLFLNTIPAYARPPKLSEAILAHADNQVNANFSDLVELRGYSLSSRNLRAGDQMVVTLYWLSLHSSRVPYRVFVHLVDQDSHVAGGKDVVPVEGAFATVLWQPGDWVKDSITFATSHDAVPGVYQLEVGLYPYGQPDNRLNLAGSDQDHVLVDAVAVQG